MDAYHLSLDVKNSTITEININPSNISLSDDLICRLCLSTKAKLSIFKPELEMPNKIKQCCDLEISQHDGLPDHICGNCADTLEIATNFRLQCHESDRILRTKQLPSDFTLLNPAEVKHEISYGDNGIDSDAGFIKEEPDYASASSFEQKVKKSKKKKKTSEPKKRKLKKRTINDVVVKTEPSKIKSPLRNTHHKSNLCTICGKYFEKRAAYHAHARSHKLEVFSCKECPKKFNRKGKLKEHMVTHYGVKNMPCDECGKLFASRAYVQKHVDKVHKRLRVVECSVCFKKLADNHTLKYHMKIHTGEKEYACEICQKQFTFKLSLQYHMRTHSGERPYACRYCEKRFSDCKSSTDHELLHTGKTPYSCPACSKGFAQLSNMKSHFRYNHKGQDLSDYPSYKKRDNKGNETAFVPRQIITVPVPPECAIGQ